MFKHTITQQEMLRIIVLIKQRNCFLTVQQELGATSWNLLDKNTFESKNHQKLLKSIEISFDI